MQTDQSAVSKSQSLINLATFFSSFLAAWVAFGFLGALKSRVLYRLLRRSDRVLHIKLRASKTDFVFRCRGDVGAVSHFFSSNYRIVDSTDAKVTTVVDGGANIGAETVRFAHHFPIARIIGIEAQRDNFALLVANTRPFLNVSLLNKALYSNEQTLGISPRGSGDNANEAFFITTDRTSEVVESITLNSIVDTFQLKSIDILKLDIEGAEQDLFSSESKKWLELVRCLIFECPDSDRPFATQLIYDSLRDTKHRFRSYICGENIVLFRDDVPWTLGIDRFF
jgi:FkbM family methyltransferase